MNGRTDRHTEGQTGRHTDGHTYIWTDGQTNRTDSMTFEDRFRLLNEYENRLPYKTEIDTTISMLD